MCRERKVLASRQVLSDSVLRRNRKKSKLIRDRAVIFVFAIGHKTHFAGDVEFLLPVKFCQIFL